MISKLLQLLIGKDVGGRMFLTVCCGIVFIYCSVTNVLDAVGIGVIITSVFKDYFNRTDRQPPEAKP